MKRSSSLGIEAQIKFVISIISRDLLDVNVLCCLVSTGSYYMQDGKVDGYLCCLHTDVYSHFYILQATK